MPRIPAKELLAEAKASLRESGFKIDDYFSNLTDVRLGNKATTTLIQTRSHQPSARYLLGIAFEKLRTADALMIWAQGRSHVYWVPATSLLNMLKLVQDRGQAAYSGKTDQQWRVNVHFDQHRLSPQQTFGELSLNLIKYKYELSAGKVGSDQNDRIFAQQDDAPEPATDANPASRPPSAPAR